MTRYGVFLILERGWVSLPEGLQQGMSSFFFFFFFFAACQCCGAAMHSCVFSHSGISVEPAGAKAAQKSAVTDSHVSLRGWRGLRGLQQ